MRIQNFELLHEDGLIGLQGGLMQICSALSQVELVLTGGFMKFQQHIQKVLLLVFWYFTAEFLFDHLLCFSQSQSQRVLVSSCLAAKLLM